LKGKTRKDRSAGRAKRRGWRPSAEQAEGEDHVRKETRRADERLGKKEGLRDQNRPLVGKGGQKKRGDEGSRLKEKKKEEEKVLKKGNVEKKRENETNSYRPLMEEFKERNLEKRNELASSGEEDWKGKRSARS